MHGHVELFGQRLEGFLKPVGMSADKEAKLDPGLMYRQADLPLATLARGETDLDHKAARVFHAGWLVSSTTGDIVCGAFVPTRVSNVPLWTCPGLTTWIVYRTRSTALELQARCH